LTAVRNNANIDEEGMPRTKVVLYRDDDGTVPLLEWLDGLIPRAQAKCRLKIERLVELGHELRRPEADFLRDGIYELRVSLGGQNYRLLYFFHGRTAAVVSHGLVKERAVPSREIDRAIERKKKFEKDPGKHTYREE
jgi:phage-related protein